MSIRVDPWLIFCHKSVREGVLIVYDESIPGRAL